MFIDDYETEGIPERIIQLMRALELDTLIDICRRIKRGGNITRTADYQLWRLKELSAFRDNYERAIKEILAITDDELQMLYMEVVAAGYARDKAIYEAAGAEWIPFEENTPLQQLIAAIMKQTHDEIENITQTTGFINMDTGRFEPLNQYFINVLDKTHLEIATGTTTYTQALKKAVDDMTASGIRQVNYDNPGKRPWHNRIDVATRRAVMTGLAQVEGKIAEDNAERLQTEYFEVSAHPTARPSHLLWQGRVYTKEQLQTVCGLGTVTGLLGANCYHHYDAFIPGISTRNWTDEQLTEMRQNALKKHVFRGKEYTLYEATQRQRELETRMRAYRERERLLKEGGADEQTIAAARIKRAQAYREYKDFSKAMGLPEQIERVYNTKK